MKINANDLKIGNIIQHNNSLWKVAKLAHTQPGKGGAFNQVELKSVTKGTKLNERLKPELAAVKKQFPYEDFRWSNPCLRFKYPDAIELLKKDKNITNKMPVKNIEKIFNYNKHFKNVGYIFKKVFK